MASTVTKTAPSRVAFSGGINVNRGQLGVHSNFTGAITNTINITVAGSITQYFSSYEIPYSSTVAAYILTLPVIGTDVQQGWKGHFYMHVPAFVTTPGVSQTITIQDSSAATIYVYNTFQYDGTNTSAYTANFTLTAIGPGANNWNIETDMPSLTKYGSLVCYNSTNNGVQTTPLGVMNRNIMNGANTTNINVLFATPVLVAFSTTSPVVSLGYITDPLFYTTTSTRVTFVRSGSFYAEILISLTNAGGGTSINSQFAIRKNGAPPNIPSFITTASTTGSYDYIVRSFFTVVATDFIEIIAGKTVVSAGTTTVNATTYFNILCLGSN